MSDDPFLEQYIIPQLKSSEFQTGLIWVVMPQWGHNFACVTTAQMMQHLQNCDDPVSVQYPGLNTRQVTLTTSNYDNQAITGNWRNSCLLGTNAAINSISNATWVTIIGVIMLHIITVFTQYVNKEKRKKNSSRSLLYLWFCNWLKLKRKHKVRYLRRENTNYEFDGYVVHSTILFMGYQLRDGIKVDAFILARIRNGIAKR